MRIAVCFDRFGPYHLARLAGAATVATVLGVEFHAETTEYAWEKADAAGFERITLFNGPRPTSVSGRDLRTKVATALGEFCPNVVAIPGWATPESLAALGWCLDHEVPAVVMSETTSFDAPRQFFKESIKRRVLSMFSAGLAGGQPHRDYLVDLGVNPGGVFTGYDVVDNSYFERASAITQADAESIRSQHNLPKRFFLASNRFVEKKNLERLLEAFATYRNEAGANAWSLVLLGDGPLRSKLEERRKNMGLEKSLLMPGFKQYADLPAYYGLASGFVHASTTEQWGLVVNEAMACGLPVLVSNRCGCASDLVVEGQNGWTFDPYDVPAMAEALTRLASLSDVERSAMGQASRDRIAAWSPDAFARGLKSAAEAALSAPPPKPTLFDRLLLGALAMRS